MSLVGLGHSEDAAVAEAESGEEVGEKVKGQWRQESDLLATAPSGLHPSGPPRGGGSHLSTLPGPLSVRYSRLVPGLPPLGRAPRCAPSQGLVWYLRGDG